MNRRKFLTCLTGLVAAPAVVKFGSLMPVRGIIMPLSRLHSIWLSNGGIFTFDLNKLPTNNAWEYTAMPGELTREGNVFRAVVGMYYRKDASMLGITTDGFHSGETIPEEPFRQSPKVVCWWDKTDCYQGGDLRVVREPVPAGKI